MQLYNGQLTIRGMGIPEIAKLGLAPDGTTFVTAVQEQLGLKLASERVPVDVVVIDAAQRPTEN